MAQSRAIKIGGAKKPSNNAHVPQSLPANFYRGYVPPKTPKIKPLPEPKGLDKLESLQPLPPPSQKSVGLNLQAGSFSLNNNKHPMSMPVQAGFMGGLKNRVAMYPSKNKQNTISEIKEDDGAEEDLTSGFQKMQMQVGSYTALQLMGGDNQSVSSFADQDEMPDTIKDTDFASNTNKNDNGNDSAMKESGTLKSAQNDDDEDDDDDLLFGMDDDE